MKELLNKIEIIKDYKLKGLKDEVLEELNELSSDSILKSNVNVKKYDENKIEIRPNFSIVGGSGVDIKIISVIDEEKKLLRLKVTT